MPMSNNINNFIGFDSTYEDAKLVVFGAPFDGTTSFRPGTRFASNTMRIESDGIETYSPYLDKDLTDIQVFDGGDLEFPFGNTTKVLDIIEQHTGHLLNDNKKPLMIGGEHLVTLPVVKKVYEKYPDVHVLHFDAHTDLREEYMGEQLSHASVIKRVWDFLGDNRIYQFGIRSGQKEEFLWAKEHTILNKFNCNTLSDVVDHLKDKPVYITIDLDVLDPSIFPGTGTPEAGGISFHDMMDVIKEVQKLNVVGADIVELSPHYDNTGVSTAVACKILRELALAIY